MRCVVNRPPVGNTDGAPLRPAGAIVNVDAAIGPGAEPAFSVRALTVIVCVMANARTYNGDRVVGSVPSMVYRSDAPDSAALMVTTRSVG